VIAIEGVEVWQSEIMPREDKALTMQRLGACIFILFQTHRVKSD